MSRSAIEIKRRRLPARQAEVLSVIDRHFADTGEGCQITTISRELGLHHETVREHVAALFHKGLVLAPGSPATPVAPNPMPRHDRSAHLVYAVLDRSNRLIKIGKTGNLEGRVRSLQLAARCSDDALVLIGAFRPEGFMTESAWHRRFSDARVSGEWFAPTPALTAELKARFGVDIDAWLGPPPSHLDASAS